MYNTREKGAASQANDLIFKFKEFAANTDFSVVKYESEGSGFHLVLNKNNIFYHFYSFIKQHPSNTNLSHDGIALFTSDKNNNESWSRQVQNSPAKTDFLLYLNGDVISYDFLFNGENFVIVTQYQNGFYSFANLGELNNTVICTANYEQSNIDKSSFRNYTKLFTKNKYSIKSMNDWYSSKIPGLPDISANSNKNNDNLITFCDQNLLQASQNMINEKSTLFYPVLYKFDDGIGILNIFTKIDDFGFCSTEFMDVAGEEFEVGGNKFVFYPFFEKEVPVNYSNTKSDGMGICLRIS